MKTRTAVAATVVTATLTWLAFGSPVLTPCAAQTEQPAASKPGVSKPATKKGHGHEHPTKGPHGGPLIELGKEKYHAELIHNEKTQAITIYLLDHSAKKLIATPAKSIKINLKHEGKGMQFALKPSPQKGDKSGQASCFVSQDEELCRHLDENGVDARLVVEIEGKSYTGKIEHQHDDHVHEVKK